MLTCVNLLTISVSNSEHSYTAQLTCISCSHLPHRKRTEAGAWPLTYFDSWMQLQKHDGLSLHLKACFFNKQAMYAFWKVIKFIYNSGELEKKKLLIEHDWDDLPFLDLGILLDLMHTSYIWSWWHNLKIIDGCEQENAFVLFKTECLNSS
jgi:hypothetical protein